MSGVAIAADRFRQIAEANPDLREYVFSATVLRLGEIIALIREITTRRLQELDSIGAVELHRGRIILKNRRALHRIIGGLGF